MAVLWEPAGITTEWHVHATVQAHAQTLALGLDVVHEPAANGKEVGQTCANRTSYACATRTNCQKSSRWGCFILHLLGWRRAWWSTIRRWCSRVERLVQLLWDRQGFQLWDQQAEYPQMAWVSGATLGPLCKSIWKSHAIPSLALCQGPSAHQIFLMVKGYIP